MDSLITEEVKLCPICMGNSREFWAYAGDRLHQTTRQIFEYSRCLDCDVLYESLRPIQEEIWKCYPLNYGPHGYSQRQKTLIRIPKWLNDLTLKLANRVVGVPSFRREIKKIERHLKEAKRMLDFGCGAGKYLDRAKKFGCVTIGMDFSEVALDQVRARGHQGLTVEHSSWEWLGVGTIDFVRMNHVVEHLYEPRDTLTLVKRILSPSGVLHLSTPNPNGPSASNYRSAWWGLECPRHIVLIPPRQMVELLEAVGFRKIQIIHEPVAKDLVRSWANTYVDRGMLSNNRVEGFAEDGLLNLWFGIRNFAVYKKNISTDRYHVLAFNGF